MSLSKQCGQRAEKIACDFLLKKNYQLIAQNYTCRLGEIDLIMRDSNQLVFVEVRYRKKTQHGSGAETITYHKQKKLQAAAEHYLQKHYANAPPSCRFDVISASGDPVQFEWIQNAF